MRTDTDNHTSMGLVVVLEIPAICFFSLVVYFSFQICLVRHTNNLGKDWIEKRICKRLEHCGLLVKRPSHNAFCMLEHIFFVL